MRAFAVAIMVAGFVLSGDGAGAQPAAERIIQPPPPPGFPPRSGTYADPFAQRPGLDLTVQPRITGEPRITVRPYRALHRRKKRRH